MSDSTAPNDEPQAGASSTVEVPHVRSRDYRSVRADECMARVERRGPEIKIVLAFNRRDVVVSKKIITFPEDESGKTRVALMETNRTVEEVEVILDPIALVGMFEILSLRMADLSPEDLARYGVELGE